MKKLLLIAFIAAIAWIVTDAQVRLATKYNYPLLTPTATRLDSVLNGLKSIRGCTVSNDVDGDGKKEIAVTSYSANGAVCIFEAAGNDSMRLVWTSPRLAPGGNSTPRYVMFGDLDNDGKQEIIFLVNGVGVVIFEWDGVIGSDNYGTHPQPLSALNNLILLMLTAMDNRNC